MNTGTGYFFHFFVEIINYIIFKKIFIHIVKNLYLYITGYEIRQTLAECTKKDSILVYRKSQYLYYLNSV